MKWIVSLLLSTTLFATVDTHLPYPKKVDANEIAKQVYFVNHQFYLKNQILKSKKKKSLLVVKKPYGKKPMVLRVERFLNNDYKGGLVKSKDLIIFLSGNLKGTGVLAKEFRDESKSLDIRMWFPALRKVRRMAEPSKNMGYSAADIAFLEEAKLRRLSDDVYTLIDKREITFNFKQMQIPESQLNRFTKQLPQDKKSITKEVYVLKASPNEQAWYDYRVDYVDTKHFTTYRTKFYLYGKVVKIIDRQWEKIISLKDERAYMWYYWYSINPETKFETVNFIPRSIVKNNVDNYKSSFWSERTLRRLK